MYLIAKSQFSYKYLFKIHHISYWFDMIKQIDSYFWIKIYSKYREAMYSLSKNPQFLSHSYNSFINRNNFFMNFIYSE